MHAVFEAIFSLSRTYQSDSYSKAVIHVENEKAIEQIPYLTSTGSACAGVYCNNQMACDKLLPLSQIIM